MIRLNPHYLKLPSGYLFSAVDRRVQEFQARHPAREIIRLGIGDVTRPLPPACISALHAATDELAGAETFRGYGPEQGYAFLREAIASNDFQARGAYISAEEIFVSDGAKSDAGNLLDLFAPDIRVAIPDPVYPAYADSNAMAGRTGISVDGRYQGLVYLESRPASGYVPELPREEVDLIYLCFPNNPTGATINREQLQEWVDHARRHKSLILFDAAYEGFIRDEHLPHSIYEIPGAREVAIELRSFSKTAGFTGLRCACAVVPRDCLVYTATGAAMSAHGLWSRRQSTRFNGVAYPVQRAAEAVYSAAGKSQVRELTDYYMENAAFIRAALMGLGFSCTGGDNCPYIWVDTRRDSWEFFDLLLQQAAVVCTPGAGFGRCGQRHVRISAFNSREKVHEAMERISDALR